MERKGTAAARRQTITETPGRPLIATVPKSEDFTTFNEFHRVQVQEFLKEVQNQILAPVVNRLEFARKHKDSPVVKQLKEVPSLGQQHRLPRLVFDATARPASLLRQSITQHANYSSGDPSIEDVGDFNNTEQVARYDRLAIPTTGMIALGVRDGYLGSTEFQGLDRWIFGDATRKSVTFTHFFNVAPLQEQSFAYTSADIIVGAPVMGIDVTQSIPVGLVPGSAESVGSGLVGVLGSATLTMTSQTKMSSRSEVFLLEWRSAIKSLDSEFTGSTTWIRNFSLMTGLELIPTGLPVAIPVVAQLEIDLMAFRGGDNDPGAGTAGASFSTGANTRVGLPILDGGAIQVPEMRVNVFAEGLAI